MIYFLLLLIITILGGGLKYVLDLLKERKANEVRLSAAWDELQAKYKDVIDLETFKQNLSNEITNLQKQTADSRSLNETLSAQAEALRRRLELYNGDETVIDCGLYTPVYDFDISQKYKDALDAVREQQKTALKSDTAATCSQPWTMNGDRKAGLKQSKSYMKLMLRAFNGESDAIISNVRWNNVDKMIERLEGVYQAINKLEETHTIKIERNYFALKLKELRLTYEYQEKLKAEKDEQRRIQEQIREEERVKKEFEKKIRETEEAEKRKRIENEQDRQHALLAKQAEEATRMQLQLAQNAEEKARLQLQLDQSVAALAKANAKVQESETQLQSILVDKERTKARAETTRAGNVYIISNIGSFGENRFKIGMSRREYPEDRIHELSDASVPFEFDIHAMIPTDNAPALESKLHERFKSKLVNLVNLQKEFFDVSIDEIAAVVREYNTTIEVVKTPQAKSYRQSLLLRQQQPKTTTTQTSDGPKQYQVFVLNNEGKQEGPYSFEQLNAMLASGNVTSETLLWYDGLTSWIPLGQLQTQSTAS